MFIYLACKPNLVIVKEVAVDAIVAMLWKSRRMFVYICVYTRNIPLNMGIENTMLAVPLMLTSLFEGTSSHAYILMRHYLLSAKNKEKTVVFVGNVRVL